MNLYLTQNSDKPMKTIINGELQKYFEELIPLTSIDDFKVLNESLVEEEKRTFFVSCNFYNSQ